MNLGSGEKIRNAGLALMQRGSMKVDESQRANDYGSKSMILNSPINLGQKHSKLNDSIVRKHDTSLTVYEMINSQKKTNDEWGIEGYKAPVNAKKRARSHVFEKINKICFFDEYAGKKKFIPGFIYEIDNNLLNNKKEHFSTLKKVSITQEVMNAQEKLPGPTTYDASPLKIKIKGSAKQLGDRSGFIEAASYLGDQSPSSNYNIQNRHTQSRSPEFKYRKGGLDKMAKIERTVNLSPGYYKDDEAYRKTAIVAPTWGFPKGHRRVRSEVIAEQKKTLPGVGKYEYEKCYDKISSPVRRGVRF